MSQLGLSEPVGNFGMVQFRVFVVDDEPAIANLLTALLQEQGYSAVGFTDPTQALAVARASNPDLLLSDFQMPNMDGLTLAEKLVEKCPMCKVLMFSGDLSKAMNHVAWGRFPFLEKPFTIAELLAAMREVLIPAQA